MSPPTTVRYDDDDEAGSVPRTSLPHNQRPVVCSTENTVFLHTRAVQSNHRTTLIKSWCPGLHGAPDVIHNYGAQFDEYDERLRRQHDTLRAVQQHSETVLQSHTSSADVQDASLEYDTLGMRACVNSSLETQLEFFVQCMQQYIQKPKVQHTHMTKPDSMKPNLIH